MPAPVDPEALAQTLRPFGQSRMLPPAAYADQAVFDWELRHFYGGWVCVARGDQLANPRSGGCPARDIREITRSSLPLVTARYVPYGDLRLSLMAAAAQYA